MAKSHVVKLQINNQSGQTMSHPEDWFESGRVADGWEWPANIAPGEEKICECYEKDWTLEGCSGYVTYALGNLGAITIAFSNPAAGTNKLNVGTDGAQVWSSMDAPEAYNKVFDIKLNVGGQAFNAACCATGSDVNDAKVKLVAT